MNEKYYRYQANIDGRTYTIRGRKDQDHMDQVSDRLNIQIQQIKENSKSLSDEDIATLMAINAMSRQLDLEQENESLRRYVRLLRRTIVEESGELPEEVQAADPFDVKGLDQEED